MDFCIGNFMNVPIDNSMDVRIDNQFNLHFFNPMKPRIVRVT